MKDIVLAFRLWLAVAAGVAGLALAAREWHFSVPCTLLVVALVVLPWGCLWGKEPACRAE